MFENNLCFNIQSFSLILVYLDDVGLIKQIFSACGSHHFLHEGYLGFFEKEDRGSPDQSEIRATYSFYRGNFHVISLSWSSINSRLIILIRFE